MEVLQKSSTKQSQKWLEAMADEIDLMRNNQVWKLVEPLSVGRYIGCKWAFKTKCDSKYKVKSTKQDLLPKVPLKEKKLIIVTLYLRYLRKIHCDLLWFL